MKQSDARIGARQEAFRRNFEIIERRDPETNEALTVVRKRLHPRPIDQALQAVPPLDWYVQNPGRSYLERGDQTIQV